MRRRMEFLMGAVLVSVLAVTGAGILMEAAHSQEEEEEAAAVEPAQGDDMEAILDSLDTILSDLEALPDIQDQLDQIEAKIDDIDKRLKKVETISLKTWDFVYKIRIPGGEPPAETKGMQDELGGGRYDTKNSGATRPRSSRSNVTEEDEDEEAAEEAEEAEEPEETER